MTWPSSILHRLLAVWNLGGRQVAGRQLQWSRQKVLKAWIRIVAVAAGIERWDWVLEIYTEMYGLVKCRWWKRQSKDTNLFSAVGEEMRRARLWRKVIFTKKAAFIEVFYGSGTVPHDIYNLCEYINSLKPQEMWVRQMFWSSFYKWGNRPGEVNPVPSNPQQGVSIVLEYLEFEMSVRIHADSSSRQLSAWGWALGSVGERIPGRRKSKFKCPKAGKSFLFPVHEQIFSFLWWVMHSHRTTGLLGNSIPN